MSTITDQIGTVYAVVEMRGDCGEGSLDDLEFHGAYLSKADAEARRDAVQEAGGIAIVEPLPVEG